jgi:hypothetical protein
VAAFRAEAKALGFAVRKLDYTKAQILDMASKDVDLIKALCKEFYKRSHDVHKWALEIAARRWAPTATSKLRWVITPDSIDTYWRRPAGDRHRFKMSAQ